jgi:hypothetical protein
MSWHPPTVGFQDFEADGLELAPIAVQWRDGTPCGILGPLDGAWIAEQEAKRLAEEAEEARREELRTLHEKVVLLDDYRNRKDDPRETL